MGWPGQLARTEAVFRPEALLVTSPTTYWTFISLYLFIFLQTLLLLDPISFLLDYSKSTVKDILTKGMVFA